MKIIKSIVLCLIVFCSVCLSGCTHEMVSLYIYKSPNKLVYSIGEELDLTGLELKNIKTDSALLKIYNNDAHFSGFDSETSGIKEITVSYGDFTASFNVYVANKVIEKEEDLVSTLNNASDNDIILIKAGEYNLSSAIEINNKNLVIGGEGTDKTILNGFIIIGGYLENNSLNFTGNTENITLLGLNLQAKSEIEDNVIKFNTLQYRPDFAGINAGDISGLKVINCEFSGFTVGIQIVNLENCVLTGNKFTDIYVGAVEITNSIKNVTISKNIITNIGSSVVYINSNNEQNNIFGLKLAFNSEQNLGVSIYKNSISKIGLKNGGYKYLNTKTEGNFSNLNYMNNSGAIILHSSDKNNLQTFGVSIFFNSIGSCLNNILYNTNDSDNVNSSSIMYMSY